MTTIVDRTFVTGVLSFGTLALLVYLAVFIAVLIDLRSGISRSKRLGIRAKSDGFRKSWTKYSDYLTLMLLFSLLDVLLFAFSTYRLFGLEGLPFLTLIAGFWAIAIEIKSVWENTDKDRQRDVRAIAEAVSDLARTKGEADELLGLISQKLRDKDLQDPVSAER